MSPAAAAREAAHMVALAESGENVLVLCPNEQACREHRERITDVLRGDPDRAVWSPSESAFKFARGYIRIAVTP